MWYVYIVECEDGKFYTGLTNNIKRRFEEHRRNGSHFTSYNHATRLLFREPFHDKNEAAKREKQLKGWTRRKKMALINGNVELLKKL